MKRLCRQRRPGQRRPLSLSPHPWVDCSSRIDREHGIQGCPASRHALARGVPWQGQPPEAPGQEGPPAGGAGGAQGQDLRHRRAERLPLVPARRSHHGRRRAVLDASPNLPSLSPTQAPRASSAPASWRASWRRGTRCTPLAAPPATTRGRSRPCRRVVAAVGCESPKLASPKLCTVMPRDSPPCIPAGAAGRVRAAALV